MAAEQNVSMRRKKWGVVEAAPSGDTGMTRVQAAPQNDSEGAGAVTPPGASYSGAQAVSDPFRLRVPSEELVWRKALLWWSLASFNAGLLLGIGAMFLDDWLA